MDKPGCARFGCNVPKIYEWPSTLSAAECSHRLVNLVLFHKQLYYYMCFVWKKMWKSSKWTNRFLLLIAGCNWWPFSQYLWYQILLSRYESLMFLLAYILYCVMMGFNTQIESAIGRKIPVPQSWRDVDQSSANKGVVSRYACQFKCIFFVQLLIGSTRCRLTPIAVTTQEAPPGF